jgi:hypothetical protein
MGLLCGMSAHAGSECHLPLLEKGVEALQKLFAELWENARVSNNMQLRRERFANFVLFLGAILWSFPSLRFRGLCQSGESGADSCNGMDPECARWYLFQVYQWLSSGRGSPCFDLYSAIYILIPYCQIRASQNLFGASMLGRYFYEQLANFYISVTVGSIQLCREEQASLRFH